MEEIEKLLCAICESLIDTPRLLNISTKLIDKNFVFSIRTKAGEEGQLIGSKGSVSNAIRVIIKSAAKNLKIPYRIYIEIVSSQSGEF